MRLPTLKVYRAFSAFDDVPDEECERYVRRVRANCTSGEALAPCIIAALAGVLWLAGWPLAIFWLNAERYVPMPARGEARLIFLLITAVLAAALAGLLVRDAVLYLGLRRELARTNCRKCGFSLRGVPVSTIGTEPDPAKTFVRCPECGRKYCLLDIGVAAHELSPFASKDQYHAAGQRRKG